MTTIRDDEQSGDRQLAYIKGKIGKENYFYNKDKD